MEEKLKELLQLLGKAINESLSDSNRIAAAMGDIRRAGYDVFLVIEATMGFNKREDDSECEDISFDPLEAPPTPVKSETESTGEIKLTLNDRNFLKALKIAINGEKTT